MSDLQFPKPHIAPCPQSGCQYHSCYLFGLQEVRKLVLTMQDVFITQLPTANAVSSDRLRERYAEQEGGLVDIMMLMAIMGQFEPYEDQSLKMINRKFWY